MSTISDALKKVQKQRAADGPPRVIREGGNSRESSLPPPLPAKPPDKPPSRMPDVVTVVFLVVVLFLVGALFVARPWNTGTRRVAEAGRQPNEKPVVVPVAAVPAVTSVSSTPVPSLAPTAAVASVPPVLVKGDAPVAPPPPVVPAPQPPPADLPVLNGTFYSPKNPVAMVNGFAVKEGEHVGAYEIVKIHAESVRVRAKGQDYELRLK